MRAVSGVEGSVLDRHPVGVGSVVRVVGREHGAFSGVNRELFEYRDLLAGFVRRDVMLRYRQTLLGPLWVLLQPLLGAGVFTFFFTSVASVNLPRNVPYFVFALVGLSLWTGFSQTLNRASSSLLGNRDLVSKIYFPRLLLPLSTAIASLVDAAVVFLVAACGQLVAGVIPDLRVVCVIPIFLVAVGFAATLGAALAALLVRFRDVVWALPVVLQALLFATPILYPLESIPHSIRFVAEVNPLTFLFEALRWCMFRSPAPDMAIAITSVAIMLCVGVGSLVLFSQLERDLTDVI